MARWPADKTGTKLLRLLLCLFCPFGALDSIIGKMIWFPSILSPDLWSDLFIIGGLTLQMRPCAPVSSRAKLRDWSPKRDKWQFSTTSHPFSFVHLMKRSGCIQSRLSWHRTIISRFKLAANIFVNIVSNVIYCFRERVDFQLWNGKNITPVYPKKKPPVKR